MRTWMLFKFSLLGVLVILAAIGTLSWWLPALYFLGGVEPSEESS